MMWFVGLMMELWCTAVHRNAWIIQHGYDGDVVRCPICGDSWDDAL